MANPASKKVSWHICWFWHSWSWWREDTLTMDWGTEPVIVRSCTKCGLLQFSSPHRVYTEH